MVALAVLTLVKERIMSTREPHDSLCCPQSSWACQLPSS